MNLDINDTILIVCGSEIVPEEKDRPLAYRIKEAIAPWGDNEYQKAVVVSDCWYLENEIFQICSTILVGGPGVNAATAELYQEIPMIWTHQKQAFVQMQVEDRNRAAIWGMNQSGTEIALNYFINEQLAEFLSRSWKRAVE